MKKLLTLLLIQAVLISTQTSHAQYSLAQLGLDINGEAGNDLSGTSVSINGSGDRVAIGAPSNDGNGTDAGHVRIYEWDGISWTQLGLGIDGEAAGDQSGNAVSINSAGDRVAIGATLNAGNGSDAGHVRIYEWDGLSWNQLGLDIDGEAANDRSGTSVSINANGDRIAIGATLNAGNGSNPGHVRIYEWDGLSWNQLGLDIDGEAANDRSGTSVSINGSGDRVAIGAPYNDGNGTDAGHVRIYEWDGISWTQLGLGIDGEAAGDQSGTSVSINSAGDRVAIGATQNAGNGSNAGHVRIYEWDGTSWTQMGLDIDGEAANNLSGTSVSINGSGDRVAIGAPRNSAWRGHVRLYEWDGTSWTQMGLDIDGSNAYDSFGSSVSLSSSGSILASGAPDYFLGNSLEGQVKTFSLAYPICLISVDNTSTKNLVVWEKPSFAGVDSVRIYREFATGNYGLVGAVSNDTLSQFTDNTFGVNPNITSYRYKIAMIDSNGVQITAQSPFHETMHLSTNLAPNGNVNLIWDAYEGFPVTYYRILRDSTYSNNWQVIDSVSSNVFIWTDINPPTTGADYIVEVIAPFTCTATKAQDHNSTRSNRANALGGGAPPVGDFTANITQINIGGIVDFFDQSINNPASWTWYFAGGSPGFSTQQNPSAITYSTPGIYDVTLVVINSLGIDTLVKTGYIEVVAGTGLQPSCDFLATATQINEGEPVSFMDLTLNIPTTWSWLFPGGTPAFSLTQNPAGVTYNTPGIYDVTLIVSNPSGADTLIKTAYIEVLPGGGSSWPITDFIASATQVPGGTPVGFLDLTLNSPTSWTWLLPGGSPAFSTVQDPVGINYNTAGTYDVTLITENVNGTDTLVKTAYIEVTSSIGVQEYKEGQVSIYPNPANDRLTVELTQIELPCFFALKDMQGRTVYSTVVNAEKLEIDLSAYAKGIYLIRVNNDNFSRELKLVKQ